MTPDLLPRLLLAVVLVFLGIGGFALLNRYALRQLQRQQIATRPAGLPVLLYFTTPTCAPCKTIQRPAIQRVQAELGEQLHIIEIDASARPDEASRWGVISVPTTILLDREGKARHINHGVTVAARLLHQIGEILEGKNSI